MRILEPVRGVLTTLERAGHAAYLVGGCVRDALLSRPIHDWDVCTSARPEQVAALFDRTVPTGLRHGTVTVLAEGLRVEVTTFRSESGYADHRRPDAVCFVTSLPDDLARRDFTVNAMAMDVRGDLTDLYGGRADLAARVLRCVGQPAARFSEDALRMLRALRFSAQLGFLIEKETADAIRACAPYAAVLSAERIRDELEKTLCSPRPELAGEMARLGLLRAVGIGSLPPLDSLAALPGEPLVRWCALARRSPAVDLRTLRLDRETCRTADRLRTIAPGARTDAAWKDLLSEHGERTVRVYAALCGETARLEQILASDTCVFLRDLAVTGRDLPDSGTQTGAILDALLRHVHRVPEDNCRERLMDLVKKWGNG